MKRVGIFDLPHTEAALEKLGQGHRDRLRNFDNFLADNGLYFNRQSIKKYTDYLASSHSREEVRKYLITVYKVTSYDKGSLRFLGPLFIDVVPYFQPDQPLDNQSLHNQPLHNQSLQRVIQVFGPLLT